MGRACRLRTTGQRMKAVHREIAHPNPASSTPTYLQSYPRRERTLTHSKSNGIVHPAHPHTRGSIQVNQRSEVVRVSGRPTGRMRPRRRRRGGARGVRSQGVCCASHGRPRLVHQAAFRKAGKEEGRGAPQGGRLGILPLSMPFSIPRHPSTRDPGVPQLTLFQQT